MFFLNSSSLILDNSSPVIASFLLVRIPNSSAMAVAVSTWSPVIITGLMPASLHKATASVTPLLGGSIIPTSPTKVRSFSRNNSSALE